ncbi:hypothetical protein [Branchiibius sp. NY16-3462-2]|nr:hypothetical protein [Branchiibius sp. NY16-3462-2]
MRPDSPDDLAGFYARADEFRQYIVDHGTIIETGTQSYRFAHSRAAS